MLSISRETWVSSVFLLLIRRELETSWCLDPASLLSVQFNTDLDGGSWIFELHNLDSVF